MTAPSNLRPNGQLRRSQVISTFGPGSMIDLPNHSIIVGGLETWLGATEEVPEPRLVEKLKAYFQASGIEVPHLRLLAPPPDSEDPDAPRTGITGWQFPEWFITQDVEAGPKGVWNRSRHLVHRKLLSKGSFIDDRKKKHPVVPIRFVRACKNGHIGDIDWRVRPSRADRVHAPVVDR